MTINLTLWFCHKTINTNSAPNQCIFTEILHLQSP